MHSKCCSASSTLLPCSLMQFLAGPQWWACYAKAPKPIRPVCIIMQNATCRTAIHCLLLHCCTSSALQCCLQLCLQCCQCCLHQHFCTVASWEPKVKKWLKSLLRVKTGDAKLPDTSLDLYRSKQKPSLNVFALSIFSSLFLLTKGSCFNILSRLLQKVWCTEALWSVSTPPLILGVCSILQFSSYSSFGAVSLGLISLFLALAPFQAAPE